MKKLIILFVLSMTLIIGGCSNSTVTTSGTPEKGAVWLVPGIEGQALLVGSVEKALHANGYGGLVNRFNWGNPLIPLWNLCSDDHKEKQSQRLADEIVEYSRKNPGKPIDIIGYSGGGGLAVLAVEKLPENVNVRNVTLVHGALSPEYDLTNALVKIDGKLRNVYSTADWLILGIGTRIFGTIDEVKTDSAGMVGFDIAKAVPDAEQRIKFEQVPWKITHKRWGGHLGLYDYKFNKKYVVNL